MCGLARAVESDIMAACESLARAETSRVHVFINASDMQLAQQLNKSRDQVLEIARSSVCAAWRCRLNRTAVGMASYKAWRTNACRNANFSPASQSTAASSASPTRSSSSDTGSPSNAARSPRSKTYSGLWRSMLL